MIFHLIKEITFSFLYFWLNAFVLFCDTGNLNTDPAYHPLLPEV